VLERASLLADDGVIRPEHLPDMFRADVSSASPAAAPLRHFGRMKLTDAELARMAADFVGMRKEFAAQLGMSERTLYRRLKALGEENLPGKR
jgi:transcriptional regulator of acetoin/glycerol metabolism